MTLSDTPPLLAASLRQIATAFEQDPSFLAAALLGDTIQQNLFAKHLSVPADEDFLNEGAPDYMEKLGLNTRTCETVRSAVRFLANEWNAPMPSREEGARAARDLRTLDTQGLKLAVFEARQALNGLTPCEPKAGEHLATARKNLAVQTLALIATQDQMACELPLLVKLAIHISQTQPVTELNLTDAQNRAAAPSKRSKTPLPRNMTAFSPKNG